MRVSHGFVSHAHVDHFYGFDALLRVCLYREEPLHLIGPPGFADRVAAKLNAYTWNLLNQDSPDFALVASEFDGERLARVVRFSARGRFSDEEVAFPALPQGVVLREPEFSVSAALLDHGIPSLAFALQETVQANVRRDALDRLGLPVGRWLSEAKSAIRRGEADGYPIPTPRGTMLLGDLKQQAFQIAPGQRVAYVTDALGSESNFAKIEALAAGADQLFIEAVYLEEDRALAERNRHLTAGQAGAAARLAGVTRVTPFHFSSRYAGREDELRRELAEAFAAGTTPDFRGLQAFQHASPA
jgi:ribonuclease Z